MLKQIFTTKLRRGADTSVMRNDEQSNVIHHSVYKENAPNR